MALRPMGVYLLTGSALRSQTRTTYHLAKMDKLAAESASLTLLANAELASSLETQTKSAIDSEEALALQSESIELGISAEFELAKAAAETALGESLAGEAEALREKSAGDASESEASFADAEEARVASGAMRARTEEDRARAALDEERSVAYLEESSRAEEIAAGAEERASEYEAVAMRREGQSIKDGEALLKTEANAMEDAEVMAACSPIPLLDLFCEAVGAVIETGYQGIAAFEGAKSAAESLAAAVAQRKEHAELVLAVEKQEEATRLAVEAERFQVDADEEGGRAALEETESEALEVEAGEAQLLGEEKMEESQEEELLAAIDEEKASEEYAKAARDESIALAEEESSIASQMESEELFSASASEEFEALGERADAESKEAKAGKMIKESLGHGMHASGLVLQAILTAGLVVYIVVMRALLKTVIPGVAGMWNSEYSLSTVERICEFLLHVGVVIGTIASIPSILSSFEDMPTPSRMKALLYLAALAGIIESFGIHSTHAACCCHIKSLDVGPTLATAVLAGAIKLLHLVPVVLIEILIVLTIFGPGIFDKTCFNPVWIWVALVPLVYLFIRVLKLRTIENTVMLNRPSCGEEDEFLGTSDQQGSVRTVSDIDKEYGSMEDSSMKVGSDMLEDVSLLSSGSSNTHSECRPSSSSGTSKRDASTPTSCIKRCSKAFSNYCEGLRLSADLLALTLTAVLMWHCLPLLRVLQPFAKSSMVIITTWVSWPILTVAVLVLGVMVHFIFVH